MLYIAVSFCAVKQSESAVQIHTSPLFGFPSYLGHHRARSSLCCTVGFPGGESGKESTCNAGDLGSIPGLGRSPGGGQAWQHTPVLLPGESPWIEEPGGLQSMGSQRVGHD